MFRRDAFSARVGAALRRRRPAASAPRSSETVESLARRVWRLEEQLLDSEAARAQLDQRVRALTEAVATLKVTVETTADLREAAAKRAELARGLPETGRDWGETGVWVWTIESVLE